LHQRQVEENQIVNEKTALISLGESAPTAVDHILTIGDDGKQFNDIRQHLLSDLKQTTIHRASSPFSPSDAPSPISPQGQPSALPQLCHGESNFGTQRGIRLKFTS